MPPPDQSASWLRVGELPPSPVAWLHPVELCRTAYQAWLSQATTAFLDRREMLAALDREPPLGSQRKRGGDFSSDLFVDSEVHSAAGVWIDFAADLGDSWEATHAMASLLARQRLAVRGHAGTLPFADLVVLGGDLVYPTPTRERYRRRTRQPLAAALPEVREGPGEPAAAPEESEAPADTRTRYLAAIPGNHDWYDGLTTFVREFCQGGLLGGWELLQKRSYFAIKLRKGWWLWGIDIALDTRIDSAQQTYFLDILENRQTSASGSTSVLLSSMASDAPPVMTDTPCRKARFVPGDNVILCTAKPSWMQTSRYSDDAYANLAYFVREIIESPLHEGRVPLILSGDLHHYSRYADPRGRQLVTSGSFGSYLMGTHHLPREVPPLQGVPPAPDAEPDRENGYVDGGFPYPSRADSRRLALGVLLLAFRRANIPFCLFVGAIYWLLVRSVERVWPTVSLRPLRELLRLPIPLRPDVPGLTLLVVIVTGLALVTRVTNRRAAWLPAYAWGALHGLAHVSLAVLMAWEIGRLDLRLSIPPWMTVALGHAATVAAGGLVGATLVGVYLTLMDRLFAWHRNDVFAAQSIVDYRSFVRIHIKSDSEMVLYPIGVRRVPRKWRSRLQREPGEPLYEPTDDELVPHLIEGPIHVMMTPTPPLSPPLAS